MDYFDSVRGQNVMENIAASLAKIAEELERLNQKLDEQAGKKA